MTREERLELLKQIEKDIHVCSLESTFLDDAKSCAIHSVIEELEQKPTVAQERYEDLCEYFGDAKDILNSIDDFKAWLDRVKWHIRKAEELYEKYEQEPKVGHWIMPVQDDGMSDPIYYQVRCSKCGFDLDPQTWHMELHQYDADKYCPKCGTPMIEPQESENP